MCIIAGATGAALAVAVAHGAVWEWSFADSVAPGDPGVGAPIQDILATYDDTTERLRWDTTFSASLGAGFRGFWLVINSGENMLGQEGRAGILYFDASDYNDPLVTAYAYNGQNGDQSFSDGSLADGLQAADPIFGKNDTGVIFEASATGDPGDPNVNFTLDLDISGINAHDPMYGDSSDWLGSSFGPGLGMWFHPVYDVVDAGTFNPTYDADGFLTEFLVPGTATGFVDLDQQIATLVPAPGAAALLLTFGLMRRRRRD